ncbi:MAG: TlpA disulfide reductase family protein [Bacteroidia bacterium]
MAVRIFAQENSELIIKGLINGDTKGFNKVYCYGEGVPKGLVQELDNGRFEFIIPFEKPFFPLFYTEYDVKINGRYKPFGVLIDKSGIVMITIENIEMGFSHSIVTGLESARLYHSFNIENDKIDEQVSDIIRKWYENDPIKDTDVINEKTDSLRNSLFTPFLTKFIKENNYNYTSLFILNQNKRYLDFKITSELFEGFTEELKKSTLGNTISDYIIGAKNSQIGSIVKNFTLQTNENKVFDFADMKGKYVVLDFWASWCGPCRKSIPHMKEIFEKYNEKNVEFIHISIDENKDYWLNAVSQENMPWIQLFDNNEIAPKLFAVTAVPTTYLIDKNGKILVKEIGFNSNGNGEIEKRLKKIYGF